MVQIVIRIDKLWLGQTVWKTRETLWIFLIESLSIQMYTEATRRKVRKNSSEHTKMPSTIRTSHSASVRRSEAFYWRQISSFSNSHKRVFAISKTLGFSNFAPWNGHVVTYRCFDVNSSEKMTTSVDGQMKLVAVDPFVVSQAGAGLEPKEFEVWREKEND